MILGKGVTPVEIGVPKICNELNQLDSGLTPRIRSGVRRNTGKATFQPFGVKVKPDSDQLADRHNLP